MFEYCRCDDPWTRRCPFLGEGEGSQESSQGSVVVLVFLVLGFVDKNEMGLGQAETGATSTERRHQRICSLIH